MTPGQHDPQTVPEDFAARLRGALEERGLSLQRLRAHLALRGVDVSVATLSYWINGRSRPTRGKSLVVLRHLERILEVPPGTLLSATTRVGSAAAGTALDRADSLERAIREHGIVMDERRANLFVHQIAHIGQDRSQHVLEERIMVRADGAGVDRWSITVQGADPGLDVEQTLACSLVRRIPVPPDLTIFEFRLPRPLAAGEMVLSTVRLFLPGDGEAVASNGLGVSRPVDRAVLEARFPHGVPARFWRTHTAPGQGAVLVDQPVHVTAEGAQTVLEAPPVGLHSLRWEW